MKEWKRGKKDKMEVEGRGRKRGGNSNRVKMERRGERRV